MMTSNSIDSLIRLVGQISVTTGGGTGIGAATALLFAPQGRVWS
jgi:hypothetical protein